MTATSPSAAEGAAGAKATPVSDAAWKCLQGAYDLQVHVAPDVIERRVLNLASMTRAVLCELGATVAEGASPIVAARFPDHDVSALARALKEKRVLVAARRGHLRVSPHLYNNEQDLEIFGRTLRALL